MDKVRTRRKGYQTKTIPKKGTKFIIPKDINTSLGEIIQTKKGSWISGDIHFFDYIGTAPRPGYINIAYIRDIPSVQAEFAGFGRERILNTFNKYNARAKKLHAFITMTESLAKHIKSIYKIKIPHGIFRAYPSWFSSPRVKRHEIVYLDHSGAKPLWFKDHLSFLDKITRQTGLRTLFVSKYFSKIAKEIATENGFKVSVMSTESYDYGSKYGILMLTNKKFNQAGEALARKLLVYLMCGISPVMDEPWKECIKYVKQCKIAPFIYKSIEDLKKLDKHDFGYWHPTYFSMEQRIGDLRSEINRLSTKAATKIPDYDMFVSELTALNIGKLSDNEKHTCLLRHDVDMDLDTALRMARTEHRHGITSTYFVLADHPYCKRNDFINICLEIQKLGHEIGYHNNLITRFIKEKIDPGAVLKKDLDYLRGAGIEINGTSAHGVKLCRTKGYSNYDIFKNNKWPDLSLSDYGLYEAYSLPYDYYIADSQGSWRITRYDEWHHNYFNCKKHTIKSIIPKIKKMATDGERLQICTHPCYWK